MRVSVPHNGKDIGNEIAAMRARLDEFADNLGHSHAEGVIEDALRSARDLIAKYGNTVGSAAHDTSRLLRDKASSKLIEQTETRPFTTLVAILGVGFVAGLLCRRT